MATKKKRLYYITAQNCIMTWDPPPLQSKQLNNETEHVKIQTQFSWGNLRRILVTYFYAYIVTTDGFWTGNRIYRTRATRDYKQGVYSPLSTHFTSHYRTLGLHPCSLLAGDYPTIGSSLIPGPSALWVRFVFPNWNWNWRDDILKQN
jgi:hypothetical protein